jgi:hypothetical protein
MSTVGSSAATDCTLHSDMINNALVKVKVLAFSICLQVDQKLSDGLNRFFGPATL